MRQLPFEHQPLARGKTVSIARAKRRVRKEGIRAILYADMHPCLSWYELPERERESTHTHIHPHIRFRSAMADLRFSCAGNEVRFEGQHATARPRQPQTHAHMQGRRVCALAYKKERAQKHTF